MNIQDPLAIVQETMRAIQAQQSAATRTAASRARYRLPEVASLLDTVEQVLPLGPKEWERVTEIHAAHFPSLGRDTSSLRRKFNLLAHAQPQSGNPIPPETIARAKDIQHQMEARAESESRLPEAELGIDLGRGIENEAPVPDNVPAGGGLGAGVGAQAHEGVLAGVPAVAAAPCPMVSSRRGNHETMERMMNLMMMDMLSRHEQNEEERRYREEQRRRREQQQERMREQRKQQRQQQMLSNMMVMKMLKSLDEGNLMQANRKRRRHESDDESN